MTLPRRLAWWLGTAIVVAAIIHTVWRAAAGTITVAHAAGLAGMIASVALVLGALVIVVREPAFGTWALLWLALGTFGGGVVAPLWRLTTASELRAHEILTPQRREVTLPVAPDDATLRLEVRAAERGGARNYVVFAHVGKTSERIESHHAQQTSVFEVQLASGQSLRLFLEYSDGDVAITLAEPPPPRWWFTILAVLAALFAAIADAASTARKWRGLFTTAVASASVYAITLAHASNPTRNSVLATAVGALFAGVLFTGLTIGPTLLRRRRARHRSRR